MTCGSTTPLQTRPVGRDGKAAASEKGSMMVRLDIARHSRKMRGLPLFCPALSAGAFRVDTVTSARRLCLTESAVWFLERFLWTRTLAGDVTS